VQGPPEATCAGFLERKTNSALEIGWHAKKKNSGSEEEGGKDKVYLIHMLPQREVYTFHLSDSFRKVGGGKLKGKRRNLRGGGFKEGQRTIFLSKSRRTLQ